MSAVKGTAAGADTTAPAAGAQCRAPLEGQEDRVLPGGWYTLWAMLVVTVFAFIDRQLLVLAAAPLAASLQLSDTELGLVQGLAFSVFTIVAVYPIAWLADRVDRRFVLGACVIAWSLGTAACGLARNFHELFAAAVLIAAGEAGLAPLTMSIVPDLFKGRKRVVANGIQYVSTYVAIALALALGGFALSALDHAHPQLPAALREWEPWRIAFFVVAFPAPLLLVAVAFMKLRRPAPASAVPGARPLEFGAFLGEHRLAVATVLGSLGLYLLAFGGFLVWLPVATTRIFGTSPAENGFGMGSATGIGMLAGVAISTVLLRRLLPTIGRVASLRVAWRTMLVTSPVLLAFPFVRAAWQVYALMGLLMVSGTAIGVLVPTMLQDMAASALRARFLAIYVIAAGLLSGIAPSVVGFMSDQIGGDRSVLYALSLVALPAWIGATVLMKLGQGYFVGMADAAARQEAG